MKNDKKIMEVVKKIKLNSELYIDYVTIANPDSYMDRVVEEIVKDAKELEKLYRDNF